MLDQLGLDFKWLLAVGGRLMLESSNIYWASSNHTEHALLATGWRDAL